MTILTQAVSGEFETEISRKLIGAVKTISEDSIRYSLHSALERRAGISGSDIRPEEPHPALPGKKVDTYIPAATSRPETILELK